MTQQPTRHLRRRRVLALGAGLALSAPLLPALAQAWPSRPIRMIVNFPPGGSSDVAARPVAAALTGVGVVRGGHAVRWRVFNDIVAAWLLTVPATAAVAALLAWGLGAAV